MNTLNYALLIVMLLAAYSSATAEVSVVEANEHVIIQNDAAKIDFDLKSGKYSGIEVQSGTQYFKDAEFRLDPGDDEWERPKTTYRVEKLIINDKFGAGKTLKIYHLPEKSYDPDRILYITLYDNKPFIVFGWGIKNPFAYPVKVKRADLLYGGELFNGQKVERPQTLRGGAGSEPNFVEDKWEISALNSAMLTYKVGASRRTIVTGGLAYQEFIRRVQIENVVRQGRRQMTLICEDPLGKLVPAKTEWRSKDTFYLDFVTSDPFNNLEQFGNAMAIANNAKPNFYDFPTLCGWIISTQEYGEGRDLNNSPGMVEQLDVAAKKNFLKYSPVAVRVEPDYYCYGDQGNTPQGWWDDEHFAKYNALRKPYETFKKYCTAVTERGGIPFTYFQASLPSNDFAVAHPEWMLNNDISRLHVDHYHHIPLVRYDYSDPGFRDYTLKVWQRLAKDGLRGVKFDYPETAWNTTEPFEDKSFTTTSAYRSVFELCRQGLGPSAFIHERALGESGAPRTDCTAGVVDLQRVWTDSSHFEPEMVTIMGLRWYKSRNVFNYYPDSKALHDPKTQQLLPKHIRLTILNVHAFVSGRLELASSFNKMTDEVVSEVTRIFPVIKERKSPRPADMFTGVKNPQVYVYPVTDTWKQVMLINNDTQNAKTISAPMSGDMTETGSLGLQASQTYHVFDFWNQKYLGKLKGTDTLKADLKPFESLVCSVHEAVANPQVLSTNRHVMQGMVELHDVTWNNKTRTLSGKADVVADEPFKITFANNGGKARACAATNAKADLKTLADDLTELSIKSDKTKRIEWTVSFAS